MELSLIVYHESFDMELPPYQFKRFLTAKRSNSRRRISQDTMPMMMTWLLANSVNIMLSKIGSKSSNPAI